MPPFDFISNCNPCPFGWTRLVFSSLERAIQLSLEAVAVVARLVAFLGTPMVSDNSCGGGVEGGGDDE